MTDKVPNPPSSRSSRRLSKHEAPKSEEVAIQDLPFPQYSLLRDGKEGAFLTQMTGQEAANKVYEGWADVALRSQVGTNTSLATILEHLQSTLIPPPGVPKIDRGSALIPYLKGVYCLSENASDNTNDLEETQVEEGNRFLLDVTVRQPTWEEISEIWKSVGMSFLRWGLIALEVPSQTYATPDGDGGEQTAPMIASGSSSGPSHEQSLKRESKSRTLPLHQARPSVLDYHLPDSAFKIKHHSELRYPEISMRRTLDDPQLAKPGGPSSNQVNGVLPHPQQETKTELETEEVKPKVKKKAFYAEQITGDRGSRAVASTWIRAMLIMEDTACEKYTRVDSVYEVYKGYTYHPPGCPPLPRESFMDLIQDLEEVETMQDLNAFVSMSSSARTVDAVRPDGDTNTPISKLDSSSSTASTSTRTRPELIRGTLRPPDKVIQKMHESIWEVVGMSWKRAKAYGWSEQGIETGREKERRETEKKTEMVRRRMREEREARVRAMERDGVGLGMGKTGGVDRDRHVRMEGKGSGLVGSQAYVNGRDGGGGGASGAIPVSNTGSLSYPATRLPKHPEQAPRVAPEDFVLLWLSRTYRRSSWSSEVTQKDLWTSYSSLVQGELSRYETRMQNYNNPRPVIINGLPSTHISDAAQESRRLSVMYNVICHYMRLRPGDVFGIVTEMFGAQLGRNGRGEYTIQGLEVVPGRNGIGT